ncbi:MAG: hypothetical protein WAQ24_00275 [Candidatus Saccharimonadales bacterium]
MSMPQFITIQEVRRNLPRVLRDIAAGRSYTVISRSEPIVTLQRKKTDDDSHEVSGAIKRMLAAGAEARKQSATSSYHLPKDASYKDIYAEDMAKKYGVH